MIEKFTDEEMTFLDDCVYKKNKLMVKINEIIGSLNSCISLGELGSIKERLSDLEQCPVNDIRQCQPIIPKEVSRYYRKIWGIKEDIKYDPKNDPEHVNKLLNGYYEKNCQLYPLPEYGTFEWVLIQMKKGKVGFRVSKDMGRYWLKNEHFFHQVEGCDTEQWRPSREAIIANDWRTTEND